MTKKNLYIEVSVTETRRIPLKRKPTDKELEIIKGQSGKTAYDLTSDILDFKAQEVREVKFNWVKIKI